MNKNNNSFLNRFEPYFFSAFIIINLIPLFFFKFLPTLDGPAHLHNSNIIHQLLFSDSDFIKNFYQLNSEWIPNWSGHFILIIFNSILPAWIADKILIFIYLIFFPLSFRWFVKSICPNNYFLSFLVFPFCYSFTFFLGFYNFSIALILMFLILAYWIKIQSNLNPLKLIILFALFTSLYFSHVFVFIITILAIGIIILQQFFIDSEQSLYSKSFQHFLRKILFVILTSGLGIFLCLKFLLSREAIGYTFIPKIELLHWIKNIRPTIVFHFGREGVFTSIVFYIIVILTLITLIQIISEVFKTKIRFIDFILNSVKNNDLWFVFSFFLLALYFFMPDSNGYSGYFSVRLGLILYLFFIVWISTRKFNKWIIILTAFFVFIANAGLTNYYFNQVKKLNAVACEINNQTKHIDDNTVVLPMNFSTNWMQGHFSNYLGIDKPIVILENYECGTGYFPVKWNDTNFPNTTIGVIPKTEFCTDWKTNQTSLNQYQVNYIFILGNSEELENPCAQKSIETIKLNYDLVSQTKNTLLYKLKYAQVSL